MSVDHRDLVATEPWTSREEFLSIAQDWATRIGVEPRQIAFREMTKKWASCSTQGIVTFNTQLLHERRDFGEAVIVHELLHLIAPNHGRLFQSLLGAYLPTWREVVGDRAVCGALR